ncbi:MAG: hypothetical protein PHG25_01740 [Candidatus Pacebacteria bacterium]|nr:hypothetical protein [Candidatus Paceibacterota bacterium]
MNGARAMNQPAERACLIRNNGSVSRRVTDRPTRHSRSRFDPHVGHFLDVFPSILVGSGGNCVAR